MAKFDSEKTGLHGVEAAVVALDVVVILFRLAMLAQHAHLASHFFVIRGRGAAFSTGAKILTGIEAERADMPHGTCFSPAILFLGEIFRAMGLAGIFNHDELEAIC